MGRRDKEKKKKEDGRKKERETTCQDSDGSFDKGISGCHRRSPSCWLCWLCWSSLSAVSLVDEEEWRTDLKKDVSASIA